MRIGPLSIALHGSPRRADRIGATLNRSRGFDRSRFGLLRRHSAAAPMSDRMARHSSSPTTWSIRPRRCAHGAACVGCVPCAWASHPHGFCLGASSSGCSAPCSLVDCPTDRGHCYSPRAIRHTTGTTGRERRRRAEEETLTTGPTHRHHHHARGRPPALRNRSSPEPLTHPPTPFEPQSPPLSSCPRAPPPWREGPRVIHESAARRGAGVGPQRQRAAATPGHAARLQQTAGTPRKPGSVRGARGGASEEQQGGMQRGSALQGLTLARDASNGAHRCRCCS